MKEEAWSIRKMRELQKLSTSRNTYKRIAVDQLNDQQEDKLSAGEDSFLGKFYQKLSLFLEE